MIVHLDTKLMSSTRLQLNAPRHATCMTRLSDRVDYRVVLVSTRGRGSYLCELHVTIDRCCHRHVHETPQAHSAASPRSGQLEPRLHVRHTHTL